MDGDDIRIMLSCGSVMQVSVIDRSTVLINSLVVISSSATCPGRLHVREGVILSVQTAVVVETNAKISMDGSVIVCGTLTIQSGGVLAGSGVINSLTVSLEDGSVLLPGKLSSYVCSQCWPFGIDDEYGDLVFNVQTTTARGAIFLFKALSRFQQMSGRNMRDLPNDHVAFNGKLVSNSTRVYIVNNTMPPWNAPLFNFPSSPVLVVFGTLGGFQFIIVLLPNVSFTELQGPFIVDSLIFAYTIDQSCGVVCQSTCNGCPESVIETTHGCAQVGSGTLSVAINLQSCPMAVPFLNATNDQTQDWVLGVAIGIPCAVAIGIVVAILVVMYQRQSSAKFTQDMNIEIKERGLMALKEPSA
jgi:hypothetical protein